VVGEATTIAEALEQVDRLRPDVVLADIDLAGESGFELVRRLHDEPREAKPRVILISTYHPEDFADLIEASPAAGFSDRDIDQLADDFIAEDRGEETEAFMDWAHRVRRAAARPQPSNAPPGR